MSQRRETLPVVARDSGAGDLLLRPLCAKHLPASLPEREGWVDREALYDFSGRSRKPQMALAAEFGIEEYAQPAGGCCFLTDAHYAEKLKDLWAASGQRDYELDDIMLLKVGRHLRPRPHYKLIIGREDGENRFLSGYRKRFASLQPVSHKGPLVLVDGVLENGDLELAARLAARFSQGRDAERVSLEYCTPQGDCQAVEVLPLPAAEVAKDWYV